MEHNRKIKLKHFCLFLSFLLYDLIAKTYPLYKRKAIESATGPQKKGLFSSYNENSPLSLHRNRSFI